MLTMCGSACASSQRASVSAWCMSGFAWHVSCTNRRSSALTNMPSAGCLPSRICIHLSVAMKHTPQVHLPHSRPTSIYTVLRICFFTCLPMFTLPYLCLPFCCYEAPPKCISLAVCPSTDVSHCHAPCQNRSCIKDKKKFCADVAPGASRVKDCLEASRNEEGFSSQCKVRDAQGYTVPRFPDYAQLVAGFF